MHRRRNFIERLRSKSLAPSFEAAVRTAPTDVAKKRRQGVYTSSALLQPNQLQDLVDILDDIVKATVGVPLHFQMQISLGEGSEVDPSKVEEINKLLESVSPELQVKA